MLNLDRKIPVSTTKIKLIYKIIKFNKNASKTSSSRAIYPRITSLFFNKVQRHIRNCSLYFKLMLINCCPLKVSIVVLLNNRITNIILEWLKSLFLLFILCSTYYHVFSGVPTWELGGGSWAPRPCL